MMSVFAQFFADIDRYGHMNWDGGWMWLAALAMMALLVVLVVWAVRTATQRSDPHVPEPTARAREILAERFAKGELSTEEYREQVDELR